MSAGEARWSPFRGLSAREEVSAVNSSGFEQICRVCDKPIQLGTRMLHWRGEPLNRGAYNQGSRKGWMHVECPEVG